MICNILPYKEFYDSERAGAIALTVRDFYEASDLKDQICIVGGKNTDAPLTPNFHYIHFTKSLFQRRNDAYLQEVLIFLKTRNISLIELHNRPNWVHTLCEETDIPVALHLHNDPQEMIRAKTKNERTRLLMQCCAVYCVSNFVKLRMLEGIDDPELIKKVHVVYNIVKKPTVLDLSHKQKIIIFVGRLTKEKGIIEFSNAIMNVLPDYPDWKALIIAPNSNTSLFDPSYRTVMKAVKSLPRQIIYYSKCTHEVVQSWFKNSAIAVLPSKWEEPFGRTVLEALNNGCALITSNRGGIPEIVLDDAVVIDDVTVQTIENELRKFITNDQLLLDYQRRALDRAQKFNKENSAANLDFIRTQVTSEVA